MFLETGEAVPCPDCRGTGKCHECEGSGKCRLCRGDGQTYTSHIAEIHLGGASQYVNVECSFCGKSKDRVGQLFRGERGASICKECVEFCVELMQDDSAAHPTG